MAGELAVFVICLASACIMAVLGIPLILKKVSPNRLYGFRTRTTLGNVDAWYEANRIAGYWLVATGAATACVAIVAFSSGIGLPGAPLVTLVPFVLGVIGVHIHCLIVVRGLKP